MKSFARRVVQGSLLVLVVSACSDQSDATDNIDTDPQPSIDILDGCPNGFETHSGTVFYVDPINGADENDGSEQSPWRSIQWVIENRVDSANATGEPYHDDAPIKAGDTVLLVGATGHDAEIDITARYNTDYVTLKAAVLGEPVVARIHFRGSAYWRVDGLSFVNGNADTMIRLEDQDEDIQAHHIQIFNNTFTSGDLRTIDDFTTQASRGIWLLYDPDHITVQCNQLSNVSMALVVFGSYIDIVKNTVAYFSEDGIATGGHHNRFIGNHIYDSIKLGNGHHDDFYQNHMGANPDVSSDLEIAYNLFQNRYSDAFPLDMQGPTQCLSAFEEGPKDNIRVYNNVCKTDHYHGISWADTHNSIFINNTVVGGTKLPGLPEVAYGDDGWPEHTWMSIEGEGNIIRNNLTTLNQSGGDHNLEVTGEAVYSYFADWDALDLRLSATSPAIDSGSADQAPADDILGTARDSAPDVGAYEYLTP